MDILGIEFPYGDHRNNLESTVQVLVRLSHKYLSIDHSVDFVDSLERTPNVEDIANNVIMLKPNMSNKMFTIP